MKKFLKATLLFFCGLLILTAAGLLFIDNGIADDHYNKLCGKKNNYLIIGASRASQGLLPSVLDSVLADNNKKAMFNFAFTQNTSSYGDPYFRLIRKKVGNLQERGLFIVEVNPFSFQQDTLAKAFPEEESFLGNIRLVNGNGSNVDYFLRFMNSQEMIKNHIRAPKYRTHEDGWLEIIIDMSQEAQKRREDLKLLQYTEKIEDKNVVYNKDRVRSFVEMLNWLKERGDVFMVRMPVSERFYQMEAHYFPNFGTDIRNLSEDLDIPFFDFTWMHTSAVTTDGNHLFSSYARNVSRMLSDSVLSNLHSTKAN